MLTSAPQKSRYRLNITRPGTGHEKARASRNVKNSVLPRWRSAAITIDTAVQIYQESIQPHFFTIAVRYWKAYWGNTIISTKIQKLQNRAARVIMRSIMILTQVYY